MNNYLKMVFRYSFLLREGKEATEEEVSKFMEDITFKPKEEV